MKYQIYLILNAILLIIFLNLLFYTEKYPGRERKIIL